MGKVAGGPGSPCSTGRHVGMIVMVGVRGGFGAMITMWVGATASTVFARRDGHGVWGLGA